MASDGFRFGFSLPELYVNPYGGGEVVTDFAFYIGPSDKSNAVASLSDVANVLALTLTDASLSINVTPKLTFSPRISAWNVIHAGITMSAGLNGNFTVSALPNAADLIAQNKLPIKGTSSLNFFESIRAMCSIGLKFDFLFLHIDREFPVASFTLLDAKQIGPTTRVF